MIATGILPDGDEGDVWRCDNVLWRDDRMGPHRCGKRWVIHAVPDGQWGEDLVWERRWLPWPR